MGMREKRVVVEHVGKGVIVDSKKKMCKQVRIGRNVVMRM
jgi:hypothetical protein